MVHTVDSLHAYPVISPQGGRRKVDAAAKGEENAKLNWCITN